jgi:putative ABC transport system substrate-binding protein
VAGNAHRRRLLVAASAGLFVPSLGGAQSTPRRAQRVALLGVTAPEGYSRQIDALRRGLRERGYVEGTNLVIDERWAHGDMAKLADLAADLLKRQPDVIVTSGPGTAAMRRATAKLPIVMAVSADAVASGHVASLARPGGNVTGSSFSLAEINVKRLQVLRQGVSGVRRVTVLLHRASTQNPAVLQAMRRAAEADGLELQRHEVQSMADIEAALRGSRVQRGDALVVPEFPTLVAEAAPIAALARAQGLPAIGFAEFAHAGGLLGYGVDFAQMWHRAAHFVDRILKGTKPADLPVEQPTRFELAVNLATARVLSLSIPEPLLVRADSVIE